MLEDEITLTASARPTLLPSPGEKSYWIFLHAGTLVEVEDGAVEMVEYPVPTV
jgi:hypothetical protein